MRIAVAGAGKVGRSIAAELASAGYEIVLIDRDPRINGLRIPGVDTIQADACEVESLSNLSLAECQVLVAATGDDKTNLVVSLLAKTEFGVPRVLARVILGRGYCCIDPAYACRTRRRSSNRW